MGWIRCTFKKHGHSGHQWSGWDWEFVKGQKVDSRSCRCGAVQRHNYATGEVTIWMPDGVDSGLLDKGLTRKIYEELE